MNAATAAVLAVILAAAIAAVVFSVHRSRKKDSSACCGCALRGLCSKK